jgi:hypothetical protein
MKVSSTATNALKVDTKEKSGRNSSATVGPETGVQVTDDGLQGMQVK